MAQPVSPPDPPRELSLPEARTRLVALVRMTDLAGGVTIISDAGRPVAALVPVDAARSRSDARAAAAHQQATVRGWQQRLETVREHLRGQHRQETSTLRDALGQAWALIDQLRPPGRDRAVDQLRAQHRQLLADHGEPSHGEP
jgi:antitoxin (DNA-binding transcriptional repressor) of toxin-antitoxin stability system